MSASRESRKEYVERIESEGYKVVYPESYELFIDIDSEEQYEVFQRSMDCVYRNELLSQMIANVKEAPSASGFPKRHVTIMLVHEVCPLERIALQAVLGSDPIRELLSIQRYYLDDPCPTIFKEKVK